MRILLTADPIIPVPPRGYGGIERIVDALARHYRSLGHTVGLMARNGSTCPVDCFRAWPGNRVEHPLDTVRNAWALRRLAAKFRPDVIHSFSRLAYLLPVLAERRFGVVMSYQRHTGGRQIAWAARLGGRRLMFTGCSEFICRQGRPAGGRWQVVPNFVELDKLTFVPAVAEDAPLVFLSRLDDVKGPDIAIAIARAAGQRLILAGNRATEGPQGRFFEREILPWLGRDGIEWIGEVNDAAKNTLLGCSAALLLPIRWDEPFGIVFAEALACGTPVITCPRGAAPEIIRPGCTGFLINGIPDGAAAVAGLASLDRRSCRVDAEQRFALATAARQYFDLYVTLLGRPAS